MKYRKASPALRMLLAARDAAVERDAPTMGFAEKAAMQPIDRRLLVMLEGDQAPTEFSGRKWVHLGRGLWSVKLMLPEIRDLARMDRTIYFEEASRLRPALCSTAGEIQLPVGSGEEDFDRPTGAGVVIGIIDDGIDLRHEDFLTAAGTTRVKWLWNQTEAPSGKKRAPKGFEDEGVEYSEGYINRMLRGKAQEIPLAATRHGTHVAAIAAGTGGVGGHPGCTKNHRGVAPQADIVFVATAIEESALTLTDSYLLLRAIQYIFAKAGTRPCVINISLGQNLGSHDGESMVEQQIDHYLERETGRAVVIAAGNENANLTHATGKLAESEVAQLRFDNVALHAGWQDTFIQIWYSSLDRLSVHLRCPGIDHDHPSLEVEPGRYEPYTPPCGARAGIDNVGFTELNGDSCITIRIDMGEVAAGEWTIELRGLKVVDGRWHAWVERSAPDGQDKVHQPHFVAEGTETEMTTLTTPSTARRAITVANYSFLVKREVYSTSGRGPTRDGREKPEIAAPGDMVWSASAGGTGDDTRMQLTGTSMSAPHVTGVIALMFEKNPRLTGRQIRAILQAAAEPLDPGKTFDNGWGTGRLNARRALELTPRPSSG